MTLSQDEKKLLQDLCRQYAVSFDKIVRLMETVREYEFKDRRAGIYDALRDVLRSDQITRK